MKVILSIVYVLRIRIYIDTDGIVKETEREREKATGKVPL